MTEKYVTATRYYSFYKVPKHIHTRVQTIILNIFFFRTVDLCFTT